jgi:hypothetical protein
LSLSNTFFFGFGFFYLDGKIDFEPNAASSISPTAEYKQIEFGDVNDVYNVGNIE